ncbi:MAG: class I SAM-dependent methyltransferase [Clostridiales bacterium]|nr:class I SAM-dependent methyltransferase [Clostridiales bacterium]
MSTYHQFAAVYDLFMEDAPYDGWTDYIQAIWQRHGIKPELVLDLACGTGSITGRLAAKGYDLIGIDRSAEMLMAAQEKQPGGRPILYLCQDMRAFELFGTVDAAVCICDGMNYLTEDGDLLTVLKLMRNYLNPGGYFIFDLNTQYKFSEILSENSFSEIRENEAYIWENYYDAAKKINEYRATFFVKSKNGRYERFDEVHYERAYAIEEVTETIAAAGLTLAAVYDNLTFDPPRVESERVFFVVRRC